MIMDSPSLKLYKGLIASIENYEARLYKIYGDYIKCRKGCSSCCILESVFPVEAWNIYLNIAVRPELSGSLNENSGECVFLKDDACIIYQSRPLICRSHGFPIFVDGKVDFCPMNFQNIKSLDSGYILNLEALNQGLASANMLFYRENSIDFFNTERVVLRDLHAYILKITENL
jgi:Fe-S-cluster containining protein